MSCGSASPLASHNLGYMLIAVKPGIVLTSLTKISLRSARARKSTRAMPRNESALNAAAAISRIRSLTIAGISAGMRTSEPAGSMYFDS